MKRLFAGQWAGEGFAKFPTIEDTAYTEQLEMVPDEYKDAIFYRQKTWYKNDTEKNGHTVFWDTGFFILKEDKILLHSVQVGGRIEQLELVEADDNTFTFNSASIENDPKSVRSQRVFIAGPDVFRYRHNMATHAAGFQNHLLAELHRRPATL
ncbi:MAG TPA: FABP family protein [Puia sp.]